MMFRTPYKNLLVNIGGKGKDLDLSILIEFISNGIDGNSANIKIFDFKTESGIKAYKNKILKMEDFDSIDFEESSNKESFLASNWQESQAVSISLETNIFTNKKFVTIFGEGEKKPFINGQTFFEIPSNDHLLMHKKLATTCASY